MHELAPSPQSLRPEGFSFVHHDGLLRRFEVAFGHLRMMEGLPSIPQYENVLYTPITASQGGVSGALYDASGDLIPASVLRRGKTQTPHNNVPSYRSRDFSQRSDGQVYLYLGWMMPHFGHFITETLARFWALRDHSPAGVKLLVHMPVPMMRDWSYVRDILQSFGIVPEDLCFFDQDTVLHQVIVPQPTLSLESHVYTGLPASLAPLVNSALAGASIPRTDQAAYFSRTRLRKGVYFYQGEEILETKLKERGVQIYYPETMTVAEQIRAVNQHPHIIGIIGSGMHNVIFSRAPMRLSYLTPRWVNATCLLLDRCFGIDSEYVQVCDRSDVVRAQWTRVSKHLPFLPKPKTRDQFHFERRLDAKLIDQWLNHCDF